MQNGNFASLIEKEICLGCTDVKYAQRAEFHDEI